MSVPHRLSRAVSASATRACAEQILAPVVPADTLAQTVSELLVLTEIRAPGQPPAHRALADAQEERARWLKVGAAARHLAERTALAYR